MFFVLLYLIRLRTGEDLRVRTGGALLLSDGPRNVPPQFTASGATNRSSVDLREDLSLLRKRSRDWDEQFMSNFVEVATFIMGEHDKFF